MIRTSLLALAVLALAVPAGASAHYKARGKDCGTIQFQAQTDNGASAIYAKRVKCRTARRIVRAYNRGNESPRGFNCRERSHDPANGLAHRDVKCTRDGGTRRVTFAIY
jgi:hypothetical protein